MENLIYNYFPELTTKQRVQIEALLPLYTEWNSKINVVSRKDIGNLYLHHVLHSLAIAKTLSPFPGARVLDVGTGGGFPGIPLAILYPDANFTLCDSIGKKTLVASSVANEIGLNNVSVLNKRAEHAGGGYDFIVSRAVTELKSFLPWIWDQITPGREKGVASGVYYLKGGDLGRELSEAAEKMKIPPANFIEFKISEWFKEPFFEEKRVIFIKR